MRLLDVFDQTFLGLELGKLFPARESLVSDIPAGDGNNAKPMRFLLFKTLAILNSFICGPYSMQNGQGFRCTALVAQVSKQVNFL